MGCGESKTEEEREAETKNLLVEDSLKKTKKELMNEIKLLLLGTGESGKSTIAKQMKIIHGEGYSVEELITFSSGAHIDTIMAIKNLVNWAKKNNYPFDDAENQGIVSEISDLKIQLTLEWPPKIQRLWKDSAIQRAFLEKNQFQLSDSAAFCFENCHRFAKADFVPTEDDIIRFRIRTTGVIETRFKIKEAAFRMVDVGGQRSERKKWLSCFESVTAIIYVVAMQEYDMTLFEDEKVNRMTESLELFGEICNSKWFTKTAIVLFLNKSDLFREKISTKDMKEIFPTYEGGCNYEAGLQFIQNAFLSKNDSGRHIFCHPTTATDRQNVKHVFDAAKEIMISQNLERIGLGPI